MIEVLLKGRVYKYVTDYYFFPFSSVEKLGQNSAAPLCQRGVQAGHIHTSFTRTSFQYFLGSPQVFQQAASLGAQQQGNKSTNIHSFHKIILNWLWNGSLSNAGVVSSIACTQVSLFVHRWLFTAAAAYTKLKFSMLDTYSGLASAVWKAFNRNALLILRISYCGRCKVNMRPLFVDAKLHSGHQMNCLKKGWTCSTPELARAQQHLLKMRAVFLACSHSA